MQNLFATFSAKIKENHFLRWTAFLRNLKDQTFFFEERVHLSFIQCLERKARVRSSEPEVKRKAVDPYFNMTTGNISRWLILTLYIRVDCCNSLMDPSPYWIIEWPVAQKNKKINPFLFYVLPGTLQGCGGGGYINKTNSSESIHLRWNPIQICEPYFSLASNWLPDLDHLPVQKCRLLRCEFQNSNVFTGAVDPQSDCNERWGVDVKFSMHRLN